MAGSLTSAAVPQSGYVSPLSAFSAAEAASLLARLHDTVAQCGGRLEGRMNQKPHLLFPWIHDVVREARVLDAVESVIGPDILCWGSQFFMKRAQDPTFVSSHQDGTY